MKTLAVAVSLCISSTLIISDLATAQPYVVGPANSSPSATLNASGDLFAGGFLGAYLGLGTSSPFEVVHDGNAGPLRKEFSVFVDPTPSSPFEGLDVGIILGAWNPPIPGVNATLFASVTEKFEVSQNSQAWRGWISELLHYDFIIDPFPGLPGGSIGQGFIWGDAALKVDGVSSGTVLKSNNDRTLEFFFPEAAPGSIIEITKDILLPADWLNANFQPLIGQTNPSIELLVNQFPLITGPPADLTKDTYIDGEDLGILLGNWGEVVPHDQGELDSITPIDSLDLGLLLADWNPPPPAVSTTIPEPSSLALLVLASYASFQRRK